MDLTVRLNWATTFSPNHSTRNRCADDFPNPAAALSTYYKSPQNEVAPINKPSNRKALVLCSHRELC
jgi:hypothetical protein